VVPSSQARSDEVGNSRRLLNESLRLDALEKLDRETLHLEETDTHDGGLWNKTRSVGRGKGGRGKIAHLGVVSPLEAVNETSSDSDDVLQRTTQRNTDNVLRDGNTELLGLEKLRPTLRNVDVTAADGRLGERVLGDLVGDVRTRKGGALDTEMLLDDFRKDVDLLVLNLDTLD
jgi:hypothetical protein